MRLWLERLVNRLWRRATWALPLWLLLFVFVSSWGLMVWVEPPGSTVVQPRFYWWWFAGTITPAAPGPGEHYPSTPAGRGIGVYVIVGGIVTITMLFTRLARMLDKAKELRMHGRAAVKTRGHIAVLGYTPARTDRIIDALTVEQDHRIVLCAWPDQADTHPLPHRDDVAFVRGDLTEDDVLERAGLPAAAAVLVDARDDDEALKTSVAAAHAAQHGHIVVALHDTAHTRTVSRVAPEARCVSWHDVRMLAAEVHDEGMSAVVDRLLDHEDRGCYSIDVPSSLAERTYGQFQMALGRWNAATVLGFSHQGRLLLSPSWTREVPGGARLYYVARRRLAPADLERLVDRAERALMFDDREMLRSEWH